ncbi:MAG: hypothetical protein SFV54_12185 [Bryobacteraceae bacterium]|nr:hypothetical protein [Bryobacteraceae bacterium]
MVLRYCLALTALLSVPTLAQHHHASPPAEKPVVLLKGLGAHRHAIRTTNPQAQDFFNQGLVKLYGFNRYEALRSFREASRLDPAALMPYWGMAMAQGPHINMDMDEDVNLKAVCAALEAGRPHRANAPGRERDYFDALAAKCPEYNPAAYVAAMKALAAKYPDDLDAATLYAESIMIPVRWRWWSPDGKPAAHMEECVRTLEAVMRRDPQHPGANHFYIHAVEMSPSPERAIPSAQRLMGVVPAAGHLVHMPGHIWLLTGDYDIAADVNERAAQVDREYMAATGVTGSSYMGYYVHNLHFVAYARSMQGRQADARKAADTIAAEAAKHTEAMPMMADAFVNMPVLVAVRFAQWEHVLALPQPDAKLVASTALWHWGRALALHAKGRPAAEEQRLFEQHREKVPANWIWLNNKARDVLAVASVVLNARLTDDVELWRKAVALEDALVYDEPPAYFYPVRESLGGALLRAGRAAEAEAVFREGLKLRPRNGRMLFGLLESLKKQGRDLATVQQEFDRAWRRSDVRLSLHQL